MNEIEKLAEEAKCNLSDSALIERVEKIVSDLCRTGGKSWSLRVPVAFNSDPDMLILELCNRLKDFQKATEAQKQPAMGDRGKASFDEENLKREINHIFEHSGAQAYRVFELVKKYAYQHPKPAMSLEECQQAIAWENGYTSIDDAHDRVGYDLAYQLLDEVAELYANQFREEQKWVKCSDGNRPDFGKTIYFFRLGVSDYIYEGFYTEGGFNCDGIYYEDDVTHFQYKYIPTPPKSTVE